MTDPHYLRQEAFLRATLSEFALDQDLAISEQSIENFIRKQPRSVVALILNEHGDVLAVTRRDRPEDWGLPGGKLDPLESPEQAVVRETREETGLEIEECSKCYARVDPTDGRVAWCYLVTKWSGSVEQQEQGIAVAWKSPRTLLDPTTCTFAGYNRGLFRVQLGME